jgi:hypothetical protein
MALAPPAAVPLADAKLVRPASNCTDGHAVNEPLEDQPYDFGLGPVHHDDRAASALVPDTTSTSRILARLWSMRHAVKASRPSLSWSAQLSGRCMSLPYRAQIEQHRTYAGK